MNHKYVYRTAPATPGLLIVTDSKQAIIIVLRERKVVMKEEEKNPFEMQKMKEEKKSC